MSMPQLFRHDMQHTPCRDGKLELLAVCWNAVFLHLVQCSAA